jgi:hypothetical protein
MKVEGDKLIFSSGKIGYANCGVVGLSEPDKEDGWQISEGYDGGIDHEGSWLGDGISDNALTKEECIELADYMIALWARFKQEI